METISPCCDTPRKCNHVYAGLFLVIQTFPRDEGSVTGFTRDCSASRTGGYDGSSATRRVKLTADQREPERERERGRERESWGRLREAERVTPLVALDGSARPEHSHFNTVYFPNGYTKNLYL